MKRPFNNWHFPDRRRTGIVLAAAFVAAMTICTPATAQPLTSDKVVLRRGASQSRVTITGTILDYTGTSLEFRPRSGGVKRVFPASEVVEIYTPQIESHVKGLSRFAQNQFADAKADFYVALGAEKRVWVRREILAMLVRCSLKLGDYQSAGSQFGLLVQSDETTPHFKLIPLVWANDELNDDLKNAGRIWLGDSNETIRLMGAGVCLRDARSGDAAVKVLNRLVVSGDRRIRDLARAQRWRIQMHENSLTHEKLSRWNDFIESMPEELRGGPYFVLGRAYRKHRELDRAAMALLWVPLVYSDDHHLAARACRESADALEQLGQTNEAKTLYRELSHRFGDTPFATETFLLPDS